MTLRTNYSLDAMLRGFDARRRPDRQIQFSHAIVASCCAVFVLVAVADVTGIMSRHVASSILGLSFYGVFQRGFLFQYLTHAFLHTSVSHLAFNMLTVWMLGSHLERRLGLRTYVGLSAISAFCGAFAFTLVDWNGQSIAIGYSAIIFGLFASLVATEPERVMIILFWPMKAKYAAAVLAAVEFYLAFTAENGGVASIANLSGGVGAFTYLQLYQIRQKRKKACVDTRIATSLHHSHRLPFEL